LLLKNFLNNPRITLLHHRNRWRRKCAVGKASKNLCIR